eukprot:scaffold48061_cov15-Tisochrysis_lutea.AAC.1
MWSKAVRCAQLRWTAPVQHYLNLQSQLSTQIFRQLQKSAHHFWMGMKRGTFMEDLARISSYLAGSRTSISTACLEIETGAQSHAVAWRRSYSK